MPWFGGRDRSGRAHPLRLSSWLHHAWWGGDTPFWGTPGREAELAASKAQANRLRKEPAGRRKPHREAGDRPSGSQLSARGMRGTCFAPTSLPTGG